MIQRLLRIGVQCLAMATGIGICSLVEQLPLSEWAYRAFWACSGALMIFVVVEQDRRRK